METVFYILAKSVQICLSVVSLAMILRMLLPIFTNPEENTLFGISCFITEPFILPARFILYKLNVGQNSPIDWSFFVTYLGLGILQSILPAI